MDAGRHSRDTRIEDEAKNIVHVLDAIQASRLGLIDRIPTSPPAGLTITDGIELFRAAKQPPKSVGGVSDSTYARYDRI